MSRLVVAIGHVEFTIANQTLYVVKVQQDTDEWEVRRTYSDFRKLRDDVVRVMKDDKRHVVHDACSQEFAHAVSELFFPAKRLFGSRTDRVVKERAVDLHHFLIKLLFLTHTYRKAQKLLYDPASASHQQESHQPHQQQASASVFFLLRDFLKPVTVKTTANTNGELGLDVHEDDESMRRMIRESKMLSMRSSSHQTSNKSMSAPNVLSQSQPNRTATSSSNSSMHPRERDPSSASSATTSAALLRKQSTIPILEERHPPPAVGVQQSSGGSSNSEGGKKTLTVGSLLTRSARNVSESSSSSSHHQHEYPLTYGSTGERSRNVSNASSYYSNASSSSRKHSTASEPDPSVLSSVHGRVVSSSTSSYVAPSAPVSIASSTSSTSSSAYTFNNSAPSSSSSYAPSAAGVRSNTSSRSNADDRKLSSSAVEGRRPQSGGSSRKASSSRSQKPRSISTKELRTSERKSKLSPQLAAQTISINAQKELERYLSEYSAIMILRYVDRFISKAVTKTPGPYTVTAQHKLVIDSERFHEELDETFKDLPTSFEDNFKNSCGDWYFPKALDAYVQMKWNSFQECRSAPSSKSSSSLVKKSSRRRRSDSDDDSESEYEYEATGGGGYMKPKKIFTDEEADVLDKMIAEGTAGKDQMLRLRRQMNELGWNRRENPGGSSHHHTSRSSRKKKDAKEYWTDTDDDEHRQTGSSGGEDASSVEHYQQKYNALRKERLSRREGGLV